MCRFSDTSSFEAPKADLVGGGGPMEAAQVEEDLF